MDEKPTADQARDMRAAGFGSGTQLARASLRAAEADEARREALTRREGHEAEGQWGRGLLATLSYYRRARAHRVAIRDWELHRNLHQRRFGNLPTVYGLGSD